MSQMLGLPHAECLTLTIGAFLAVRSIVLASQAEQKTPELSEVAHECVSTEAELARRLQAAEAALAAKDAELAAERAVAREAVAQAVAAREATVRAQAARASAELAAAEVVVAAELVQAQAAEAWRAFEEARIAHVAELKAKDDSLDAAREAIAAMSAGAETAVDNALPKALKLPKAFAPSVFRVVGKNSSNDGGSNSILRAMREVNDPKDSVSHGKRFGSFPAIFNFGTPPATTLPSLREDEADLEAQADEVHAMCPICARRLTSCTCTCSADDSDGIGAADERRAGRGSPRLVWLYTASRATVIDRLSATLCFTKVVLTLFCTSNK